MTFRKIRWSVCLAIVFALCAKKQESEPVDTRIAVIGGDTLLQSEASKYLPDTLLNPRLVKRISVTHALTRKMEEDSLVPADVRDFAEQLSMTTNKEWSPEKASLLFSAGRRLYRLVDTAENVEAVRQFVDSMGASIELVGKDSLFSGAQSEIDSSVLSADTSYVAYKKTLAIFFERVLFLNTQEAELLAEFVLADRAVQTGAVKTEKTAKIKGLIADTTSVAEEIAESAAPKPRRREPKKDGRLALKHRNQQSIQDSIALHIPQIQALYKKHLKVHQDMSGVVYVRFEVAADGKVENAGIKNSQIQEADFIDPFLAYVKGVRFKPIPGSVGSMTFDFPFEFSPES